ncbi:hypothetical protein TVAG_151570 [Trichomonas vaginalis G3]|uniref:Uncharacterized protein n=1 Tax=Trichomonas vaginalis (strain ATCC PRA-98 / G3) TaxID=412133 RepID=A2ELS2_TRIV3|nr:hypothetical protein TVAGG3_0401220 [Trichomonas vaginalis G3]EAY06350.1 hypothetical protein TVAG_151570 [Trichomonas vaginalis G3]KAI5534711.1 hypothetical protein TVAGG3_0401220 [Trichomonas vaginalis G3]|eukprot:XP_001318573.1 hypothetical protein [Trichomonas vaginalis G3]
MALWGRVIGFVSKFEQDIDAEFARNPQAPPKEQEESIQIEDISDNDISHVNFKENESDENKKKLLIESIQCAVKQIEELNSQQVKLIALKQEMGTDGERCLTEYEKRKEEFQNQINQIANTEKSLKEEIEQLMPHQSELTNVQTEKELVTNQANEFQSFYLKIQQDEIEAMAKLSSTTNKLSDLEQEIIRNTALLEKYKSDEQKINKKIPIITERIKPLVEENERLSNECGILSINLRKEQTTKTNFLAQQANLHERINGLKNKISDSNKAAEQVRIDKIQQKAIAMKEFTSKKISQINKDKEELLQQIADLQEFKSNQKDEFEYESSRFKALLDVSRIENQQLNVRMDSLRKSLKDITRPLREQIDSLKLTIESSENNWNSFSLRVKQEIAENNAKIENFVEQSDKISQNLKEEKDATEETKDKIQNLQNKIEDLKKKYSNEVIQSAQRKLEEAKQLTAAKQNELTKKQLSFHEYSQKLNSLARKKSEMRSDLEKRLKSANDIIEQGKKPSTFIKWKKLTKQLTDLEKEEIQLRNEIKQNDQINILFEQSVEIISERQEQVDSVRRTIQQEKDNFQKQLLQLCN